MAQVVCTRCKREFVDSYPSCPWCGMSRPSAKGTTDPLPRLPPTPPPPPRQSPSAPIPQAALAVEPVFIPKLPVWQLAWYSLKLPFAKFPWFFRMAIVPMAISEACYLFFAGLAKLTGMPALYYLGVFAAITTIPFHVGWFRMLILGTDAVKAREYFPFGEREKRYLYYGVVVALISIGPLAAIMLWSFSLPRHSGAHFDVAVLALGASIFGVVASLRLLFVLPAVALDRFSGFAASWEETKGMGLRLWGVIAVIYIPMMLAVLIPTRMKAISPGVFTYIMMTACIILIANLGAAAMLGAIGVAYRDWGIRVPARSAATSATSI
ncbi:MAG: hypothetical protein ACLQAT_31415 [Candidatus Binataceae bacterium]